MKKINLTDLKAIKDLRKDNNKLFEILKSNDFMLFFAGKCEEALNKILNKKNLSLEDMDDGYFHQYRKNNIINIDYINKTITIMNETKIKLNPATWISQATFEKGSSTYPNLEFDLADAIEYGTGPVGEASAGNKNTGDWVYEQRERKGDGAWAYRDSSGKIQWTRGMEGRFIYYTLRRTIVRNAKNWINEYIDNNL